MYWKEVSLKIPKGLACPQWQHSSDQFVNATRVEARMPTKANTDPDGSRPSLIKVV